MLNKFLTLLIYTTCFLSKETEFRLYIRKRFQTMPRPLKNVSPDTLGGRIRAARQALHLSLADVAGNEYSTSLISQIERNKIEPSAGSLRYLAEQLHLPLDELIVLAQQHRESEVETHKYQKIEDLRIHAAQLLDLNRPRAALEQLQDLTLAQVPNFHRWRIIALRGQCFFGLRQFLSAQREFLSALAVLPEHIAPDQYMEVVLLRLHLAAASRELGQYETAYEHYQDARAMMNSVTPLRYIAEAHWGLSLVLYEQAYQAINHAEDENGQKTFKSLMQRALTHAENARTLYNSIEELLRAALLNCQIALIEQALGNLDAAGLHLQEVLDDWTPTIDESEQTQPPDVASKIQRYSLKERANVVSAAACYLASVEHEANDCDDKALEHIELALKAGQLSYILRRADAYMTKGQILADRNDPSATEAFHHALAELENTDRLGAKIRVHRMLGEHLIKQGVYKEGQKEIDKALRLAKVPSQYQATSADEHTALNN